MATGKSYPEKVAGPFPTGWAWTDATHYECCPRCGAEPGFYCVTPSGRKASGLSWVHGEREKAYFMNHPEEATSERPLQPSEMCSGWLPSTAGRIGAVMERVRATPEEIDQARSQYQTDDIEIDDDAVTSSSEEGTWVSAWVWIGKGSE